ncbi:MAG: 4Fe-4S dicluster domain-containing protein [Verrucomicrobia bacterium]|nr:4Fe-4S dicluster domain-containing protein [Verrucomicrobiota bacterium]
MNGAMVAAPGGVQQAITDLLRRGLDEKVLNAVLVPARVPAGDSFAWLLVRDSSVLEETQPLPPVMSVQGARAISRYARGGVSGKVAAVLRPCEVRATVELAKLRQVELDGLLLVSMDCPGALPLKTYLDDPQQGDADFEKLLSGDETVAREVCKTCHLFSRPVSDLHFATLGADNGQASIVAGSEQGRLLLDTLRIAEKSSLDAWERAVAERQEQRKQARTQAQAAFRQDIAGPDKLLETLSQCLNCHVCRSVCPICYCRQCYFESQALLMPPDNTLARARRKGGMRLPTDTLLFHLGRMAHMSLSCVSCGACEDACPSSIPVARMFSLVGDATQKQFDYTAGRSVTEPLPTITYKEDELSDLVAPYFETYSGRETAS